MTTYDEPSLVARKIFRLQDPTLLVLDCDGVLAPLVDHADDSELLPGIRDALADLAGHDDRGIQPAILSGRSLAGLEQFDFPERVIVVGSYGGERRGQPNEQLTDEESLRLQAATNASEQAAKRAGDGAWVERKPGSVVLHVREAENTAGEAAIEHLHTAASGIDGAEIHHGSNVLEIMARPSDKGSALRRLRADEAPSSVVYIGDDLPDEDAFAVLGDGDLGVKVGDGDTLASLRLADPDAVRALVRSLATADQNNEV